MPVMQPAELRAARASLGMTQSELAAALEVDLRTVQKWEGAERAIPGPARVALRFMLLEPPSAQSTKANHETQPA